MLLGYNTNGLAFHRWDDALRLLAEVGYESVAITLDHHCLDPFAAGLPAEKPGTGTGGGTGGTSAVTGTPGADAGTVWRDIQNTTDLAVVEDFILHYGDVPVYGRLARAKREQLAKLVVPPPPPARALRTYRLSESFSTLIAEADGFGGACCCAATAIESAPAISTPAKTRHLFIGCPPRRRIIRHGNSSCQPRFRAPRCTRRFEKLEPSSP